MNQALYAHMNNKRKMKKKQKQKNRQTPKERTFPSIKYCSLSES
jgi:hypothetical protein